MSRTPVFVAALALAHALAPGVLPTGLQAQGKRLDDVTPYLMERGAEIALARSAAPNDLGDEATIWVLTHSGYEVASPGSNGFTCFVGRGWSGPILVGPAGNRRLHPDVFDTEVRAPHCLNPKASRSVMPWQRERTRLLLEGVPAEDVDAAIEGEIGNELSLPEPGAMAYMMSPGQDLGPDFGSWRPHVMIYIPRLTNADWGIAGFTHDYPFVAESGTPWSVAVVPMRRYSDGSWAPQTVTGRHRP